MQLTVIDENTVFWKDETYVAVPAPNGCEGCAFEEVAFGFCDPIGFCGPIKCSPYERTSRESVIFIKKEQS